MGIRIKDIIKLTSFKGFKLIAGNNGIDRIVSNVCLMDFDFSGGRNLQNRVFRPHNFIIYKPPGQALSPERQLAGLQACLDAGVSCIALCIEPGQELFPGAVEFCNAHRLPLFVFDIDEVYLEHMIYEVMHAIQESSVSFSLEREIDLMMQGQMTRNDIVVLARAINPDFQRSCSVSYIRPKTAESGFSPEATAKRFVINRDDPNVVVTLVAYHDGLIVFFTMPRIDKKIRSQLIDSIISVTGFAREQVRVSHSTEHLTTKSLDEAVRECYSADMVCQIKNASEMEFEDIGTYRFLIPNCNSQEELEFMRKYIKQMNREQLETAEVFVKCNGNYEAAATQLGCHHNTIRYRINKIKEYTDPAVSEFEFQENLSAAIKIYLITGALLEH
ncbi:MAG: PucR family transcriptional regulator [Firmicutes bacterium]|nr:PucR family transcriptional regulator [Bacillota bacterium]